MDVVKTNIEKIGGTIELKSTPGVGTTFIIKIPLTLAIVSALIVEAGKERFAIPQISVVELVRAQKEATRRPQRGRRVPRPSSSGSTTRRSCGCATGCCRWSTSTTCWRSANRAMTTPARTSWSHR